MLHEENFVREYKDFMKTQEVRGNAINLPLPEGDAWKWKEGRVFEIRGIEDEVFSGLNGERVFYYQNMKISRRKRDRVAQVIVGADGKVEREPFAVPRGSMAVFSTKRLEVPYRYTAGGLNLVDVIKSAEGLLYCYTVPKSNLYEVNRLALIASTRSLEHHKGVAIATWNLGVARVMVVPYKIGRKYVGSKILLVKDTMSFDEELMTLLRFWVEQKIMPIPTDFVTEQGNIVYKVMEPKIYDYDEVDQQSVLDKQNQGIETLEEA